MIPKQYQLARALFAVLSFSGTASALELNIQPPLPTLVGSNTTFTADVTGAEGTPVIRWTFGDGAQTEFISTEETIEHAYEAPGHYTVIALVQDGEANYSYSFVHAVHKPLTPEQPRSSSELLLDEERGLVVTLNAGNDTISLVDLESLQKVAEIPVFKDPVAFAFAPDGKLWVVHRETYAIAIVDLDQRKTVDFFRLPYASQPVGIVFGPSGDAYVPLFALGDVIKIDGSTREITEQRHVGPFARGITISGDGETLWVTRFISQGDHGEVYRLDPETLETVGQYDLIEDTTTEDSDVQGRGLPNYLFSVAVSPDGTRGWVPSKKDNMARGLRRDGLALTQDNAVRPLVSILDLEGHDELYDDRIDLDDRNLPRHVTFNAYGDWAFISVYGSNLVELRDAYNGSFITALRPDGLAGPSEAVLDSEGRLFVLASLSRELFVFDVADLMNGVDQSTQLLEQIPLVAEEKLSEELLRGLQIFANAEDKRMASEGYVSCDSCHFEGFEDGLVWDFFDRGEGFRNTTSLLGRRGMGHGRVHWSGNFDEIQDFENPIRAHQGGLGFITGEVSEPLGEPKAGLDEDLDALAAFVASLDRVPRSPYRNSDGTLTAAAEAGKELFLSLGCDSCHSGDDFTDSATNGELHDVGTLTEFSGGRLGGDLPGIDTPTLLGIWQTAPYLHDGSAPTLKEIFTARNTEGKHGDTASLTEEELDNLVAYLQQIDHGLPPEELQLPGSEPGGTGGSAGAPTEPTTGGAVGVGGAVASTGGIGDPGVVNPDPSSGCGCKVAGASDSSQSSLGWWALGGLGWALARRRRSAAS